MCGSTSHDLLNFYSPAVGSACLIDASALLYVVRCTIMGRRRFRSFRLDYGVQVPMGLRGSEENVKYRWIGIIGLGIGSSA